MNYNKRKKNEKKFQRWIEVDYGGGIYFFEVLGRNRWIARYNKEVDANERTIRFWQEIIDDKGNLNEIHEKYPVNNGHILIFKG
jgi:hypothetical protein